MIMKTKMYFSGLMVSFIFFVITAMMLPGTGRQQHPRNLDLNFEQVPAGKIPAGWKVEATMQRGPLATWQVVEDQTAPSGKKILSLTSTNHTSGSTFNLCWDPQFLFLNGEISVMVRANKGLEDQGGGVIWRARDKDNYYISRYNPLENNFRIYYVKNGSRTMLASARIAIPAHRWFELKITVDGDVFRGYLNGKKLLEAKDDTFKNAGGTGLWVKADGKTSFDNFHVAAR